MLDICGMWCFRLWQAVAMNEQSRAYRSSIFKYTYIHTAHTVWIYLLAGKAWKTDINHRNIHLLCVSNTLTCRCGKNGKRQTHTRWKKLFEMVGRRGRYCCCRHLRRQRRCRYHPTLNVCSSSFFCMCSCVYRQVAQFLTNICYSRKSPYFRSLLLI